MTYLLLVMLAALLFVLTGCAFARKAENKAKYTRISQEEAKEMMARANRVQVSVTYYEACKDVNHEAYGSQGQYKTVTGICWNVDAEVTKTILVDKMRIPMGDIVKVEAPGKIFETRWEDQSAD